MVLMPQRLRFMVRRGLPMLSSLNAPLLPHLEKIGFCQGTTGLEMKQTNKQNHKSDKGRKAVQTTGAQKVRSAHVRVREGSFFYPREKKICVNSQLRQPSTRGRLKTAEEG